MNRSTLAVLGFLFLAIGLAGFLTAGEESYTPLVTAPGTYRGLIASADTTVCTAPIDVSGSDASVQEVAGNPTLAVSARLTSASATVSVACLLWHKSGSTWTLLGQSDSTATASSRTDAAGRYVAARDLLFDTGGATHYELRVEPPSSGSVLLVPRVFGYDTRAPR